MPIREEYCMFRFNTSVYSTVGTEYELKVQMTKIYIPVSLLQI